MVVECFDCLVAILCAALFILTVVIMSSSNFEMIDNMIAVDTSFETGEEGALSPSTFLPWLLVCTIAGIVAAVFGCAGVAPRNKPGCLSTHLLMMLILGVVFLVISVTCSQFESTMEPIIARQVVEFCGPTTYPTYADRLNCSSQPLNVVSPCGADCEARINLIRTMGRCSFLDGVAGVGGLCRDYFFFSVGSGSCLVNGLVPPTFTGTKATIQECEAACAGMTSCSAFSFTHTTTTCVVVSNLPPADVSFTPSTVANTTAAIAPIGAAVGRSADVCFRKGNPNIVYDAYNDVFAMASVCYMTAALMFAAAIVGAIYTFTIATGQTAGSKKGLDAILKKMCCPCLWPRRDENSTGKHLTDAKLMEGGAE